MADDRAHREKMLKWLLTLGKDPDRAEGYAQSTVLKAAYRIDTFYRWVRNQHGGYTTNVTREHADEYVKELTYSNESNTHKANCVKALKKLFKWRHHHSEENSGAPR